MRRSRLSNRQRVLAGETLPGKTLPARWLAAARVAAHAAGENEDEAQQPVPEMTVAFYCFRRLGVALNEAAAERVTLGSGPGVTCRQIIDAAATLLEHVTAARGEREEAWDLRYLTASTLRAVLSGL